MAEAGRNTKLDGKRYYYAHFRKNYHNTLAEGQIVKAGDVVDIWV